MKQMLELPTITSSRPALNVSFAMALPLLQAEALVGAAAVTALRRNFANYRYGTSKGRMSFLPAGGKTEPLFCRACPGAPAGPPAPRGRATRPPGTATDEGPPRRGHRGGRRKGPGG